MLFEGGERAAQAIRLFGCKPGPDDRDLHRLLLKQGHTEGLAQNLAQFVGGERDLFLLVPAPDEGMHHIALDRPGADDRDLDHQIVKGAGPHPRQEIHLGPAFDLKDPQAVGSAKHVVGGGCLPAGSSPGHNWCRDDPRSGQRPCGCR